MQFAVTLQCLGKLYSGTVYSGKQRNIYEHIYRTLFPQFTSNPPVQKHSGSETFSKGKHIYKDTHQRSYLKLWKTLLKTCTMKH